MYTAARRLDGVLAAEGVGADGGAGRVQKGADRGADSGAEWRGTTYGMLTDSGAMTYPPRGGFQ